MEDFRAIKYESHASEEGEGEEEEEEEGWGYD